MKPTTTFLLFLSAIGIYTGFKSTRGADHMENTRHLIPARIGGLRYCRPEFGKQYPSTAKSAKISLEIFSWPQGSEMFYREVFEKQFRDAHGEHEADRSYYRYFEEEPLDEEADVRTYWRIEGEKKQKYGIFALARKGPVGVEIDSKVDEPTDEGRVRLKHILDGIDNSPENLVSDLRSFFLGGYEIPYFRGKEARAHEGYADSKDNRFSLFLGYGKLSKKLTLSGNTRVKNFILGNLDDDPKLTRRGLKTLRQGERVLDGMRGHEIILEWQKGRYNEHHVECLWQFEGRPVYGRNENLDIEIEMRAGAENIPSKLIIWDQILDSVERMQ